MGSATEPLIDDALASFAQGAVSITVGACDRHLRPCLVRAAGCRISSDRRRVTLFLSASQSTAVLDCVRDHGAIAAVFSQPTTHRTVQLKGTSAEIGALEEGDLVVMATYRAAFAREVAPLGFAEPLIQTLFSFPAGDVVRLSFCPVEAFLQTPGPNAGARLKVAQ